MGVEFNHWLQLAPVCTLLDRRRLDVEGEEVDS